MRRQIEKLYRRANHGHDNRTAEQAGGDFNRKANRKVIDDIASDVKALKDAYPTPNSARDHPSSRAVGGVRENRFVWLAAIGVSAPSICEFRLVGLVHRLISRGTSHLRQSATLPRPWDGGAISPRGPRTARGRHRHPTAAFP